MPSSQWFGSGLGQRGSTSKTGACTVGPDPALLSSIAWQAPSAARTATNAEAPMRSRRVTFIGFPLGCKLALPPMLDAGKILVNCLAALALALPACARAHDIPTDVQVNAFVVPEGPRLRLLVR